MKTRTLKPVREVPRNDRFCAKRTLAWAGPNDCF